MTRLIDRMVPDEVLRVLDNWRIWFAVTIAAIAALAVWVAFVNAQTARTAASTAKTQAIRQAAIESDYKACVRSIPSLGRVNRFLGGVNDLARILVLNSQAALQAEPPGDPLHQIRVQNLARLRRAGRNVASIQSFPVPTVKSCATRRAEALERG